MSKRRYSATRIKKFSLDMLKLEFEARVVLAVDVAKENQVVAFRVDGQEPVRVSWKHPTETPLFFEKVEELRERGMWVQAVLEPTGTYGEPFVEGLRRRGVEVFQAKGKQVHDAREVYDRVPSSHDGKTTELLLHLHDNEATRPWKVTTEEERGKGAVLELQRYYEKKKGELVNMLEAKTARHWPELTQHLALTTTTACEVLVTFGGPAAVAGDVEGARELMRRTGGSFLKEETREAVLESAASTVGVPMTAEERELVQTLAAELREARKKAAAAHAELKKRCEKAPKQMVDLVGTLAAIALLALGLDPRKFENAKSFEKALGMNLRENSSGRRQGRGVHITKRGDSFVRQLLYFATLRTIKDDPVVKAWFHKKVQRDGGGSKARAVVAVMRKLVRGLWHVTKYNEKFDASRLFDTARLKEQLVSATAQEEAA